MEKQKSSKRSRSCDRLSELPDSLIFNIFEFLPMNDVIKTTILSKRWKDLWTTVPFLNFTDSSFRYDRDIARVRNFVNRALLLWKGVKILKFTIDFRSRYDHYTSLLNDDLNVWVRWAKEREVEEIHLCNMNDYEPYDLPECLYSCSSLKVLVLSLNYIRLWCIRENIKWNSLKSLTIDSDYFGLDPEFISQALRGSPNLEVFNLTLHINEGEGESESEGEGKSESVCIQSSSLKKLSISKRFCDRHKEVVEIVTPNLKTLEISGYPYIKYVLSASSSLTDVTLRFDEKMKNNECDATLNFVEEMKQYKYNCGETLSQILPAVQHVERVRLPAWCIKVLKRMNKKHLLSRPYIYI